MKIDHLILNIDRKYQSDSLLVNNIKKSGLPYEPTWGKGTSGFKVSNLWIGKEYLEMTCLKKSTGGGWKEEWVDLYNKGNRGLVCLMIEVNDIYQIYNKMRNYNIIVSEPQTLQFKWFFNLLTRKMPWKNSYFNMFENVPLQIGLHQMDSQKARVFMEQYMVPNSKDNGISGISKVIIAGDFTENDFQNLCKIFNCSFSTDTLYITLDNNQQLIFRKSNQYTVDVITDCSNEEYRAKEILIENCKITHG